MTLPAAFLSRPIAHRALHNVTAGRPENSLAAIRAAIEQGYGIEIDLQRSHDDQAMVFHDYDLGRLTPETGAIAQRTKAVLHRTPLTGGSEGIPSLAEVLALINGQVPLLIEIKDQDGGMGPRIGPLEEATATALQYYKGPVAVMSFNPNSVAAMACLAPDVPRGLTTSGYRSENWPLLPTLTRERLRGIPDFDRVGACFISHEAQDLSSTHVAALKSAGVPVLCWTIRSPQAELEARKIADNITFEGYLA